MLPLIINLGYYRTIYNTSLSINGVGFSCSNGSKYDGDGIASDSFTFSGTSLNVYLETGVGSTSINSTGSGSWSVPDPTPSYWNDVNVYSPSGVQDYKSGYFDLYTSENNRWRYNLTNEDDDMTHKKGTYFQVQNIRPYYDYYTLDRVTGYDSIPSSGAYRKTFDAADEVLAIYMKYKTYWNNINGCKPDGTEGAAFKFDVVVKNRDGTQVASHKDLTDQPSSFTYEYGYTATVSNIRPNITGIHYTKNSVTNSAASSFSWTFNTASYAANIYSAWNTYTVAYNANGGEGSTASSSHTYGTAKKLTANGFVRIGYSFAGWNTKADGSGTSYSDGQSVKNLTSTNGATVTLYAQWSLRVPYNIFTEAVTRRDQMTVDVVCTGIVSNVKVYYKKSSDSSYQSKDLGKTYTTTLTGLTPNTNYDVYATVSNAAGTGTGFEDTYKTGAYLPPSVSLTLSGTLLPTSAPMKITAGAETNASNTNYKFYRYTHNGAFNFYDMALKSLSDGSLWARVFYHNCKEGSVLFSSLAEIKNTTSNDKFSRLDKLSEYKRSDGKYEFMLCYPNFSATQYNRWKQTNNPMEEYITPTTTGSKAAGYTAVHIDWTGNYWGGLTRQNSNASTISNCYLSGSVGHTNWFYAIGATNTWNTGIPMQGSDTQNWGSAELWVRIDDKTVTTIDSGTSTTKSITGLTENTSYIMWASATNVAGTNYSTGVKISTPYDQSQMKFKSANGWKIGRLYYKQNGEWIRIRKLYSKQNGEWKQAPNF